MADVPRAGHHHRARWFHDLTTRPLIHDSYQRFVSGDYRAIKTRLAAFIVPGVVHVDLGCGTANLYPFVRSLGGRYIGSDSDGRAIAHASRRYPEADFRVADATRIDERWGRFARVFSVGLLHHLSDADARRALRAVGPLLSPGGRYLIIDAIPPRSRSNVLGRILRALDNGAHVRGPHEYLALVHEQGWAATCQVFGRFPLDYVAIEATQRQGALATELSRRPA